MHIVSLGAAAALLALAGHAEARRRPEDLKRQIESEQAAVGDLERLDDKRVAVDELALLRSWYDEAWGQYGKEEYDRVREILERTTAQAELIRQKSTAGKLSAQAADRENAAKVSREKLERTKKELQQATIKKKAMEMNSK
jgi:hypothetical protein